MSLKAHGAAAGGRIVQSVSVDKWVPMNGSSKPYVAYVLTICIPPVQQWTVKRRYTEFQELAAALAKEPPHGAGRAAPCELPPRHAIRTGWRQTLSFGSATAQEHAHQLAHERLPELKKWIEAIVQNPDPLWRSSRAFRTFLALPEDAHFNMALSKPRGAVDTLGAGVCAPANTMPGSWDGKGRRLGAAALAVPATPAAPSPAKETSATRGMEDDEVFQNQAQVMERQDDQLHDLTAAVRRQRQLGLTINQELREQTEMLGQVDRELDGVQNKMVNSHKLMRRLDNDRPY